MAYNSYGGSAPMGRGRGFAPSSSSFNSAGAGYQDPRLGPHAGAGPQDPRLGPPAGAGYQDPRLGPHAGAGPQDPRLGPHAGAGPQDPRLGPPAGAEYQDPRLGPHAGAGSQDPRLGPHAGAGPQDLRLGPPAQGTWHGQGYGVSSVMHTGSHYPSASHYGGYASHHGNSASPTMQASPHSALGHPAGPHPGMSGGQNAGSGFESSSNSDTQRPTGDSITIAKTVRFSPYAEMVERLVKNVGLTVDIKFTKPDVNLTEFLKPIAKSGVIFAVIISPETQQARNVNFYQFRGLTKPQYHKHVPLAITAGLMLKKYNELEQKEVGPVPEAIKHNFSRVINGELLDDLDYKQILSFVHDRKTKQYRFKNRTGIEADTRSEEELLTSGPEFEELQKKVAAIIANFSDTNLNNN